MGRVWAWGGGAALIPCDPGPALDWHSAMGRDRVLLLGELHGTAEIPQFTAQIVCTALQADLPVALMLEWPRALQPTVDAWMTGSDDARADLLSTRFMSGGLQDGRRSAAMLGLAEEVVRLRQVGAPVSLVLIDPAEGDRNLGMADHLRAWRTEHPGTFVVALAGNLHVRTVAGLRDDATFRPAGLYLREAGVPLTSVNARYATGSAWNCQSDGCAVHPLAGEDLGVAPQVHLDDKPSDSAYDGWFYVGTPTASMPAVGGTGADQERKPLVVEPAPR